MGNKTQRWLPSGQALGWPFTLYAEVWATATFLEALSLSVPLPSSSCRFLLPWNPLCKAFLGDGRMGSMGVPVVGGTGLLMPLSYQGCS